MPDRLNPERCEYQRGIGIGYQERYVLDSAAAAEYWNRSRCHVDAGNRSNVEHHHLFNELILDGLLKKAELDR